MVDTLIASSFIYIIYKGGTGTCGSIKIIFGNHVYSQHTILNIKFGKNWTLYVPKTLVYRFDLYGRYQTLWTDIAHFEISPISPYTLYEEGIKMDYKVAIKYIGNTPILRTANVIAQKKSLLNDNVAIHCDIFYIEK